MSKINDEAVKDIKKAKDAIESALNYGDIKKAAVAPDARKHKYISFVKSGLRIVACYFLAYYDLQIAAVLLALAEILGVAEEMV
jgi:hypothetical protein